MHATLRKLSGLTLLAALVCIPARPQQQSSQQSGSGDPVAEAAKKAREQKGNQHDWHGDRCHKAPIWVPPNVQ